MRQNTPLYGNYYSNTNLNINIKELPTITIMEQRNDVIGIFDANVSYEVRLVLVITFFPPN